MPPDPTEPSILLYILLGAVALLLASGVVSALVRNRAVEFGATGAVGACLMGLLAALAALARRAEGTLILPWSMPYGSIQIGLDPLSAFFLIPLFLLSGLAAIYAVGYFRPWKGRHPGRFWLFYNALVATMAIVLMARNGVLFLVAWEAMSLASFFLVVFDDMEPGSSHAGWVYLVATHIGTAFLLALFILLGRAGGSPAFATTAVPAGSAGGLFLLALIGFGTKAGLFPLHLWLPEAHPAAPSPVSAVMSGVMIKMGVYGIVRTLAMLGAVPAWCAWLVLVIGALTGILGILFALAQRDLKRMLAYSSVENIGIIALALGLGMLGVQAGSPAVATLGFAGAFLHLLNHSLFKGLLFLGAGAVVHATGTRNLEHLGGLLKRMPWTGAAFLAGAVAICGLPPFNGFVGEFLIYVGAFKSVIGNGPLSLAGIVVLLSLALIGGLAVAGFTRVFGIAFLGEPRSPAAASAHEAQILLRAPMLVLAALCLGIGLAAGVAIRAMEPVVTMFSGSAAATEAIRWVDPASVGAMGALLIALTVGLVFFRQRLLEKRSMRETGTWDCGYAAPAPRMQYTATGYAQPLTLGAQAILRSENSYLPPNGIFPTSGSHRSETPDAAQVHLYDPLFKGAATLLGRLSWLQHGRVHLYVLYILIALMVLLAWAVRL